MPSRLPGQLHPGFILTTRAHPRRRSSAPVSAGLYTAGVGGAGAKGSRSAGTGWQSFRDGSQAAVGASPRSAPGAALLA